jgi:hypothetical protein
MAYRDTIAKADLDLQVPEIVTIDTVSGRNTQFTIRWDLISNASDYEVEIYSDAQCSQLILTSPRWGPSPFPNLPLGGPPVVPPPPWFVPANPLDPAWVIASGDALIAGGGNALLSGQEYFVRARIRDQIPNDAIRSPYSSVKKLVVEAGGRVENPYLGVQPLGPVIGATSVPRSPGFSWSPQTGATRYEFQLATDAGFTDILAEAKVATTGYKYDGTLDYETTYFWRVRAIEPSMGNWSPVANFTTEKAPPPPPEPEPAPPPPPEPVVTPTIIWAIIGIGAVLVIAVIVLIVRTRRAA